MNLPLYQQQDHSPMRLSAAGQAAAQKPFFEIHTLEWLMEQELLQPDQFDRLHWHEITWFTQGSGTMRIDSKTFSVDENHLFCILPGQVREYQMLPGVKGYRICFTQDFLQLNASTTRIASWLDFHGEITVMAPDEEMKREMEAIIQQMNREFLNYYLLRSEIISGLLNILIIYLSRKVLHHQSELACSKDTELVRRFKHLLKRDFASRKMVSDYAAELCVTPNYLNRTVKKITGYTASHHIQQQIILEAKRQAVHSNVSMKEIAYFLGFDNLAHFSKFFKNNSGMNFSRFKKELTYTT